MGMGNARDGSINNIQHYQAALKISGTLQDNALIQKAQNRLQTGIDRSNEQPHKKDQDYKKTQGKVRGKIHGTIKGFFCCLHAFYRVIYGICTTATYECAPITKVKNDRFFIPPY